MSKQGIAVIALLVFAAIGSEAAFAQDAGAEAQETQELQLQRELELERAEMQRQRQLERAEAERERELLAQEAQLQRSLEQAERERQQEEVRGARAEMEQARRELEQAARTIATQVQVAPELERFQGELGNFQVFLRDFGNQARIGASVVDAEQGALITQVTPGSGAETAGLKVGDVIQSVNGTAVATADEQPTATLREEIRNVEPGETVALVVERAGRTLNLDVETERGFGGYVGQIPRNGLWVSGGDRNGNAPNVSILSGPGERIFRSWGFASSPWGDMELVTMSETLGRYFDTDEGLLVLRAPEDDAIDIQDGDVILSISNRTPNSAEHAIRILSSFESGETVEFSIMRDGRRETIEYTVPEQNATLWQPNVVPVPAPPAPVPTPN
ncbi:MAG TPA: PDZ domain-containing protein [Gammaproteobacteria bacterium]|nr:PDZ domain-containing protein [Gammaproteobacteria bacterium]